MTSQLGYFQEILTIYLSFTCYTSLSVLNSHFWSDKARTIDLVQYLRVRILLR